MLWVKFQTAESQAEKMPVFEVGVIRAEVDCGPSPPL